MSTKSKNASAQKLYNCPKTGLEFLNSRIKLIDCSRCGEPLITHESERWAKGILYRKLFFPKRESVFVTIEGKPYCKKCRGA